MRLICARNATEEQATETVLKEFFEDTPQGWVHKRCDSEIARYHSKSKSAANSANARWKQNQKPNNANASKTQCDGNANHKPITTNKGTRLTKDFPFTKDFVLEAQKIHPSLDEKQVKFIFDGFVDHWVAESGAKAVKMDWLATWRNWMRRQKDLPKSTKLKLAL